MRQYFSKQNRALLSELVRTDFKLRYQGSVLGYAWSLLRPLFLFLILYIVFVRFFNIGEGVPHFPVYLLLGIVLWQFFADMTTQSLGSVVGRGDLIRKIRIPRWIIVLSSSILALINLLLNLVVVGIFMALNDVPFYATALWLPFILLEIYLLALGLSFFLAAAFVKFRDINYIWEVIMQAAFYLTPVLYPMYRISDETLQKLVLLNPMAQAIQDARYVLISHDPIVVTIRQAFDGGWYALIPFVLVLAVFAAGLQYFKSQSNQFAENI